MSQEKSKFMKLCNEVEMLKNQFFMFPTTNLSLRGAQISNLIGNPVQYDSGMLMNQLKDKFCLWSITTSEKSDKPSAPIQTQPKADSSQAQNQSPSAVDVQSMTR